MSFRVLPIERIRGDSKKFAVIVHVEGDPVTSSYMDVKSGEQKKFAVVAGVSGGGRVSLTFFGAALADSSFSKIRDGARVKLSGGQARIARQSSVSTVDYDLTFDRFLKVEEQEDAPCKKVAINSLEDLMQGEGGVGDIMCVYRSMAEKVEVESKRSGLKFGKVSVIIQDKGTEKHMEVSFLGALAALAEGGLKQEGSILVLRGLKVERIQEGWRGSMCLGGSFNVDAGEAGEKEMRDWWSTVDAEAPIISVTPDFKRPALSDLTTSTVEDFANAVLALPAGARKYFRLEVALKTVVLKGAPLYYMACPAIVAPLSGKRCLKAVLEDGICPRCEKPVVAEPNLQMKGSFRCGGSSVKLAAMGDEAATILGQSARDVKALEMESVRTRDETRSNQAAVYAPMVGRARDVAVVIERIRLEGVDELFSSARIYAVDTDEPQAKRVRTSE